MKKFHATTGFILRHWLVVTKIAGCDILNFLVVVTDYADGFGSYINIYTAGKSGTALLLLRLAFLQNSLQGIAPLDVYKDTLRNPPPLHHFIATHPALHAAVSFEQPLRYDFGICSNNSGL